MQIQGPWCVLLHDGMAIHICSCLEALMTTVLPLSVRVRVQACVCKHKKGPHMMSRICCCVWERILKCHSAAPIASVMAAAAPTAPMRAAHVVPAGMPAASKAFCTPKRWRICFCTWQARLQLHAGAQQLGSAVDPTVAAAYQDLTGAIAGRDLGYPMPSPQMHGPAQRYMGTAR